MTASAPGTHERDLTPIEISERIALRDQLDDERDDLLGAVESRRREIRSFNRARKKIETRLLDVRRELRSGKVIESPQGSLGLDTSLPDPFGARYPMARDHERLQAQLAVVLEGVLVPSVEKLEKWHPDTGIFQNVAHWARTELAYLNAKDHPDLPLPPRQAMPEKLAELRMYLGRQVKAHSRKKASKPRAIKVRPASGTPTRTRRK